MEKAIDAHQRKGRRLWHVLRAVYCTLRKSLKGKLFVDLESLFKRGKLAAVEAFATLAHRDGGGLSYDVLFCRHVVPESSFYSPPEVEFSCSNTPNYFSFHPANKRRRRRRCGADNPEYRIAAVAKTFEILNTEMLYADTDAAAVVAATPSPVPWWFYGKSPVAVRRVRITDSPFLAEAEETVGRVGVDKDADEFIRMFYEQLRMQKYVAASSPEIGQVRRATVVVGRA